VQLLEVRYRNFRNLVDVVLRPSAQATVAVGENGQGKTNLLEGLYFLTTLKALRAGKLSELIRFGCDSAWVEGTFVLQGAQRTISVEVLPKQRLAAVDGKRTSALESYFGGVSVVAFTPDDLHVIKGGPEGRRNFFDRATFNRFPAFLNESRDYAKALKSRNRLLKDRAAPSHISVWDAAVAKLGARLLTRRRALLAELAPRAVTAFERIGRLAVPARFSYHPDDIGPLDVAVASEAELEVALAQSLAAQLPRDVERGFTSVGPHTDDLAVHLGEVPARAFASQGQSRALVLAWKIAEIENLRHTNGFLPLLLLDDVSSELDPERNAYLMQYIAETGAQTLMTTTDAALVQPAAGPQTRWLKVSRGEVT
jgi:DNA replication and repair protein RecF